MANRFDEIAEQLPGFEGQPDPAAGIPVYDRPMGATAANILRALPNPLTAILTAVAGLRDPDDPRKRFQTWPEVMTRSGLSLPGDVLSGRVPIRDVETGELNPDVVHRALDTAGLAAGGSVPAAYGRVPNQLQNVMPPKMEPVAFNPFKQIDQPLTQPVHPSIFLEDAAPGTGISGLASSRGLMSEDGKRYLRPALKYEGKIYKAPMNGTHQDAIPKNLQATFEQMALSGDDISHFNFGFMNHKGQFMSREDALRYGIDEGLLSPHDAKYGALTSAIYNDNQAGTGIAGVGASQRPAPVWYSAVEHAVENAKLSKATPEQWVNYIRNQPGVKMEELNWLGLGDDPVVGGPGWQGTVTKKQIQDWLNESRVEVKETRRGEATDADIDQIPAVRNTAEDYMRDEGMPREDAYELVRAQFREDPSSFDSGVMPGARYSDYQLPGGENYREVLFTMPYNKKGVQMREGETLIDALNRSHEEHPAPYKSSHWDEPNVLAHTRVNDRQFAMTETDAPSSSVYTVDPRYNEIGAKIERGGVESITPQERALFNQLDDARQQANNARDKLRALHIEEIQSDWHQAGRKQGYKERVSDESQKLLKDAQKDATVARDAATQWMTNTGMSPLQIDGAVHKMRDNGRVPEQFVGTWAEQLAHDYIAASKTFNELNQRFGEGISRPPNAPFKSTWPDLVLKRMLREAVDNGYDAISWTPGRQQAERYSLEKQISKVDFVHNRDMIGTLQAMDHNGRVVVDRPIRDAKKELPELLGEEIAKKLLDEKHHDGNGVRRLSGLDLRVGGEGMRQFYDKMLVDKVNALGKKFGAKVEWREMPGAIGNVTNEEMFKAWMRANRDADGLDLAKKWQDMTWEQREAAFNKATAVKVPFFRIPDKMREAMQSRGFPLFQSGIPFPLQPVDYDPFKDPQK